MAYVLILQHVPVEGPGLILESLEAAGAEHRIRNLLTEQQPELPPIEELSGVVLMGGPMDAADVRGFPALALEQQLVREAISAKLPMLGVCLGHQIIAAALGAGIEYRATREIGVAGVHATGELAALDGVQVLHWHTDNAGLPAGATRLASTAGCPNQAFRYRTALGLQFHLEVTEPLLEEWLRSGMGADLAPDGADSLLDGLAGQADLRERLAKQVFGHFADQTQAMHGN